MQEKIVNFHCEFAFILLGESNVEEVALSVRRLVENSLVFLKILLIMW